MDENLNASLLATLNSQIEQLKIRRAVCEWQMEDAASSTGNDTADKQLRQDALIAANTIAMLNRQIATREARAAQLRALVPANTQPAISAPPTTQPGL